MKKFISLNGDNGLVLNDIRNMFGIDLINYNIDYYVGLVWINDLDTGEWYTVDHKTGEIEHIDGIDFGDM